VDCQNKVYTECQEKEVKTCKKDCETTGGAIFCDGKFLHADDIEDCAAALADRIDIHVDLSAVVHVDVDTKDKDKSDSVVDKVDDKVDDACAVATMGSQRGAPTAPRWAAFGLMALGLVVRRVRQRRVAEPNDRR
jgi:hypothetical protein